MKTLLSLCIATAIASNLFAQSLSGVESVEYDPINDRYLASSDNGSIVAIAPNGALSYFGSGLTADYGMEVMNGTLFVIAGSAIKGYDLTTATQVMSVTISGAQFLNGMGSNGVDKLWVSDFNGYDIYEVNVANLSTPTFSMVADQMDLGTTNKPNGIVYDGDNNRIVFVNWGSNAPIKAMNLTTYAVSTVVPNSGVGNIDGIDKDSEGNWYIASWSPARITKYTNNFSSSEVITVPGISSPADICYATETDTLAIPGGNQVIFVGFESPTVGMEEELFEPYRVYYSSGYPVVQFELSSSQDVSFDILDMSGRTVFTAMQGLQSMGKQTVVLSSVGLYSGAYLCRVSSKEVSFTERIVIP